MLDNDEDRAGGSWHSADSENIKLEKKKYFYGEKQCW